MEFLNSYHRDLSNGNVFVRIRDKTYVTIFVWQGILIEKMENRIERVGKSNRIDSTVLRKIYFGRVYFVYLIIMTL